MKISSKPQDRQDGQAKDSQAEPWKMSGMSGVGLVETEKETDREAETARKRETGTQRQKGRQRDWEYFWLFVCLFIFFRASVRPSIIFSYFVILLTLFSPLSVAHSDTLYYQYLLKLLLCSLPLCVSLSSPCTSNITSKLIKVKHLSSAQLLTNFKRF